MWSWLSRCWGGIGVSNNFEKARIRSIITDWKVPDDDDLAVLISSFRGDNPEINYQTALTMFLSHLETDDQRSNPIFLLKHVYILDQTVEERTALETISKYYTSEFSKFRNAAHLEVNPLRELVAAYFLYVRLKASTYIEMDPQLFESKRSRVKFLEEVPTDDLFTQVDRCLSIQRAIREVNNKYSSRNKSVELISMTFTLLFKSYLFCYTVVATALRVMFSTQRMKQMVKPQLQKMRRFVAFFNREYTQQYVNLVQSNLTIEIYKDVRYSELILIDKACIEYLDMLINRPDTLKDLDSDPAEARSTEFLVEIPQEILTGIVEQLKVQYRPRKLYEETLRKDSPGEADAFYDHENLCSDAYDGQFEESVRNAYSLEMSKSSSKLTSSEGSTYQIRRRVKLPSDTIPPQCDKAKWQQWRNVFAT